MPNMRNFRVVAKSVVSKRLYADINDTLCEALVSMRVNFGNQKHRISFVEVIEDFFEDVRDTGLITQFRVVFDSRNNTFSKNDKEFVLEIHYRQPHCQSMTTIYYYIPMPQTRSQLPKKNQSPHSNPIKL